MTSSTSEPGKG